MAEARYKRTVLGTVCLPWRDDFSLDEERFTRTVGRLVAAGLPDLYLFGTAGEGYAVTETVFRRVVELFAGAMEDAGGAAPMVGIVSLSLPTMIERIAFCRSLGVRTFQFSLPAWQAVNDAEMARVFAEICGRFEDCQFLHYNLMRSGRMLRGHHYAPLAERHTNLVATKYGGGDPRVISGLLNEAPQLRHFFTEAGYFSGAPLGPCGLLTSLSSSNPARARAYMEAGANGEWERFAALYAELAGMHRALMAAVGDSSIDGAYDKIFLRLDDAGFPLSLLPPYTAASLEAYEAYRAALEAHWPDWLPDGSAR